MRDKPSAPDSQPHDSPDSEMKRVSQYFFRDVKGLGNVAVSRHAQDQMDKQGISEYDFKKALLEPIREDIPDGQNAVWRERGGIRIVIILKPTPDRGAKLAVSVYRIQPQAKAIK